MKGVEANLRGASLVGRGEGKSSYAARAISRASREGRRGGVLEVGGAKRVLGGSCERALPAQSGRVWGGSDRHDQPTWC